MTMPFGCHRGVDIRDLPTQYLRWLLDNVDLYGRLRSEVEAEYGYRGADCDDERERIPLQRTSGRSFTLSVSVADADLITEVIQRGYRAAAKEHDPDLGNSPDVMQRLNTLRDHLESQLRLLR